MNQSAMLQNCPLFDQISPSTLETLLSCLGAARLSFQREAFIFLVGDAIPHTYIVQAGSVHIVQEDFWGNRSILARMGPGELFGEAQSFSGQSASVSAVAAEAAEVLRIDASRLITPCSAACPHHARLILNMARILAQKNMLLTQKIEHLTRKTTREKLLSYLSSQAQKAGSSTFDLPFSRQELADYLSVDRSALSAELSRMQRDRLLSYQRNRFTLQ